jgi:hypothetical protein
MKKKTTYQKLKPYLRHKVNCFSEIGSKRVNGTYVSVPGKCDCGLVEAMQNFEAEK